MILKDWGQNPSDYNCHVIAAWAGVIMTIWHFFQVEWKSWWGRGGMRMMHKSELQWMCNYAVKLIILFIILLIILLSVNMAAGWFNPLFSRWMIPIVLLEVIGHWGHYRKSMKTYSLKYLNNWTFWNLNNFVDIDNPWWIDDVKYK